MIKEAVERGLVLAQQASQARYAELGGDQMCCGFAWVDVEVSRTNSREAKELISAGFKKSYRARTLTMWNPGGLGVQNIDIKEAGADAMAEVLREVGLKAYAGSRLD